MQTTNHILMVRPVNFVFNTETAVNNSFQIATTSENVHENALREFDAFVEKLRSKNIDVLVVDDTMDPHTPDSIFPNNWISFHGDGSVVLYPMFAHNRRFERKPAIMVEVRKKFSAKNVVDLTSYERREKFLEGTGSMVLDRDKHIAYACVSPRTDIKVLNDFCKRMTYRSVLFHANDQHGKAVYHTNVMMCVADKYVVICADSIPDSKERLKVADAIKATGKEIISITLDQMNHFAGNMLQVNNGEGKKFLVMSTQAVESLTDEQVARLSAYNEIIHSSLNTIEQNGGGSARCMMAEIHLPLR